MFTRTKNNREAGEMSFLDHLEALRWHLVRSAVAIVVLSIIIFLNNEFVFGTIIFGPKKADFITYRALCNISDALCVKDIPFEIINLDISGQFMTHIWVSMVGGFIIAIPYVLWELWRFIKPALYDKETKATRGVVLYSSILFLLGVLFSYYLVVPLTINFLGTYQVSQDIKNQFISMDSYISTITTLTLLMGTVFELPIIVFFLTKIGVLTPSFMKNYRRHAIVVILVVAALITPSSDVLSLMAVALPLYFLYEASIFVSSWEYKKREFK